VALPGAFAVILAVGWHQHFIGLEETRRYFYEQPNWREYPPEYLKKIASNRIYATLFYPNALAGVILLLTPVWLSKLWQLSREWTTGARTALVVGGAMLPMACLAWSGSKAGWLILVGVGALALLRSPAPKLWKTLFLLAVLVAGLGGFLLRYFDYLSAGATSARARTAYWKAAATLALERPLLGSGPGTFMVGYKRLKAPEDEMTRLAHNDYLQQASDSGIPGFLLFAALVLAPLAGLYRKTSPEFFGSGFAVWLGLTAFAAQSFVEFGLYIPALAWTFFGLLGWLSSHVAQVNPLDNRHPPR
jgi:O-antigen ligase